MNVGIAQKQMRINDIIIIINDIIPFIKCEKEKVILKCLGTMVL